MVKRNQQHEQGQAFIELGISMVFLLVLLAGIMDLGRAIFTYISIRDAVQEGASFGAIEPTNCAGIEARILNHTEGAIEFDNLNVTVEIEGAQCNAVSSSAIDLGDSIRVAVVFEDFQIAAPFIGAFIGTQTFDLSAEVSDTILVDPSP